MGGEHKALLKTETGDQIDFQFNPAELTIVKRTQWGGGDAKGGNAPHLRFQGGQSGTMTVAITLDSTVTNSPVTTLTDKLVALVTVDPHLPSSDKQRNSARPPWVEFHWGPLHSFKAIVEQLQIKFTYFKSDGTPLRAKCDLSLKQWSDDALLPKQNPTSYTPVPHTLHCLRPGETLERVAGIYYRDPSRWRLIAEANGIDDPMRPPEGATLTVPELPVRRRA
jgi:nucleoid-associated protein YgaU